MTVARDMYGEPLAPGAIAGPYVVERMVREGGFSYIYRARHTVTGETVALKVLKAALAESARVVQRFRQEVRALERLRHPNIVHVFAGSELYDGRPFFAMKWLDGRNLADELRRRGAFSPAESLAVMEQVCGAVATAHASGIIHRDIKAENIVAVPDGDWYSFVLVDFGIAKLLASHDTPLVITENSTLGTPLVMAPEQIHGEEVDERTDVYALGLLAFQLVTGSHVFSAATLVQLEELHLHAAPPRATDIAPVSPAFDAVLARALAKRRQDRQPDVPALMAALREAIDGSPASGPAAGASVGAPSADIEDRPGIAVHVRVRRSPTAARRVDRGSASGAVAEAIAEAIDDEDTGPMIDDVIDDILDDARDAARSLGLTVIAETGDALIAAGVLPGDAHEHAARRLAVVEGALALREQVVQRAAGTARVAVDLAIHVGPVAVSPGAAGALVGGGLLRPSSWPSHRAVRDADTRPGLASHAVIASGDAIDGLSASIDAGPIAGVPDCYLLSPG